MILFNLKFFLYAPRDYYIQDEKVNITILLSEQLERER